MALAHTYTSLRTRPSLGTRILEHQRGITTIPAGGSGIRKPTTQSFTERYRGTEYETCVRRVVVSEPLISRGRQLWIVSGTAVAVVIGVVLAATPA